jgi:hypothetical protein
MATVLLLTLLACVAVAVVVFIAGMNYPHDK